MTIKFEIKNTQIKEYFLKIKKGELLSSPYRFIS